MIEIQWIELRQELPVSLECSSSCIEFTFTIRVSGIRGPRGGVVASFIIVRRYYLLVPITSRVRYRYPRNETIKESSTFKQIRIFE